MKKLLISLASLLLICVLAWFQKIAIVQLFLDMRFDLQLELDSLEISPGNLLRARGTGFSLSGEAFDARASDVYVELRLDRLRGQGYYLALVEANDGMVDIVREKQDATDDENAANSPRKPVRWIPESFNLNNVSLHYQDDDQDINTTLEECVSKRRADASEIDIDCRGLLQQAPIEIVGRYGLPDPSGNAEPLDLRINWGRYSLTAEGKLDAISRLQGAELNLSLSAPTATPLLNLLGATEVREGVVELEGSIHHDDAGYAVRLFGELSGIALSLDGSISDFDEYASFDANFSVAGPSLFEIGALFNEFRLQPQPFYTSGHVSFTDNHLKITDVRIGVEQGLLLANVDMPGFPDTVGMEVDIKAEDFRPNMLRPVAEMCQLPHEQVNIDVEVAINDDGQTLSVDLDGPSFDVMAFGTLNETPGTADLNLNVTGTSLEIMGHCIALQLPDDAAELRTRLHFANNTLVFSEIDLSSELAAVNGEVTVGLDGPLPFSTNLDIDVPDALTLIDEMANYQGPLKSFPFRGNLVMEGHPQLADIKSFEFNAAGHDGALQGSLGNPATLEGLALTLHMEGENLRHLLNDRESSADHDQPYRLTTQIINSPDSWMIEGLDLELVETRVQLDGRLTRLPMYLGSHLKVKARGKNIQNLLGPWVDHPVPELPFSVNTNIEFTEEFFRFENLHLDVGGHELKADMSVDRPPDYSNTFGQLVLNGPSSKEIAALIGLEREILDRPYKFSFNLKGDLNQLTVSDLEASIDETDVSGEILFRNTTPYHLNVDLVSESLYLPLLNPSLIGEEEESPSVETGDDRVLSDARIPTAWLRSVEGEFTWDIQKAWTTEKYATEIMFDLALEDGELTGRNIHWDSDDSKGDVKFRMQEMDGDLNVELDARSSRLPVVWLLVGEALPSENTSFRALLNGKGNSVRNIMANLDGSVLWSGGSGRIQSSRLELLFGDFLTAATSAIVGRQSDDDRRTTLVSCTAGGIHFTKGTAHLAPGIVSRTDRTDFYASGSIDLAREKLKLVFLTKSRTGIGLSPLKVIAPRLKVGGTMTDPRFSVDTASTALSTSAAFFSGGASVLATGLWDRMSSSTDACQQLQHQAISLPEFTAHTTE